MKSKPPGYPLVSDCLCVDVKCSFVHLLIYSSFTYSFNNYCAKSTILFWLNNQDKAPHLLGKSQLLGGPTTLTDTSFGLNRGKLLELLVDSAPLCPANSLSGCTLRVLTDQGT